MVNGDQNADEVVCSAPAGRGGLKQTETIQVKAA
jgi:hypothetical protein